MSYAEDCILYSEEKRDWIMVEFPGNKNFCVHRVSNDSIYPIIRQHVI
jgi:hypothetical protein